MSWTLNLHGHNNDPETMESVIGIVRAAGFSIDAITDRDGGDTFGGTFSGPNVSISFPEPAAETVEEAEAAQAAAPAAEYDDTPDTPDTDVSGT